MADVGTALLNDRIEQGITQGALAREIGVSQQILSKWEANLSFPRGRRVDDLIRALGRQSRTAQVLTELREKHPRLFLAPGAGALPMSIEARERLLREDAEELARRQMINQAAVKYQEMGAGQPQDPQAMFFRKAMPSPPYPEVNPPSVESLQIQFVRASEQLVRITALVGRVAAQLDDTAALLAKVGDAIKNLQPPVDERPDPDPPE